MTITQFYVLNVVCIFLLDNSFRMEGHHYCSNKDILSIHGLLKHIEKEYVIVETK